MFALHHWGWSELCVLSALLFLPFLFSVIIRKNPRNHRLLLPPCPPKLPVLGNLHQLGSLPHQSLHALSKKHGPLMLLKLGQVPTLVVSSADTAREIMRTHDHIFSSRPSLKATRIIFNGGSDVLFSPYGECWRQLKKLCVSHLLNPKMVLSFGALRQGEVSAMVLKISKMCSSSSSSCPINMSEVLNSFMSKLLCRVLFGNYLREEASFKLISELIEESSVVVAQFSIADCIPLLGWLDKFSGLEARAKKMFKNWDALLEDIVEEHEKRPNEDKPDFTHVLLALQKDEDTEFSLSLSRVVIKAILMDMLAAGIDTSFIALDWAMTELIRNPKTMKKLQDEVRGIAKPGSTVRDEDLGKMNYLKAVIKEVLRLHPPGPLLLPRESMERCMVQGYEIPKQTRVLVNAWAIGRDPRSWDEPEEFRPERFIGSSTDYRGNNFEFTPFGAGRRMCAGIQFASATMEFALANLVNKFDWELPDGTKCEDLDMADSPGITTRRRQRLFLVAKPLKI